MTFAFAQPGCGCRNNFLIPKILTPVEKDRPASLCTSTHAPNTRKWSFSPQCGLGFSSRSTRNTFPFPWTPMMHVVKIKISACFRPAVKEQRSGSEMGSRRSVCCPVPVGYLYLCSFCMTMGSEVPSHNGAADELNAISQYSRFISNFVSTYIRDI